MVPRVRGGLSWFHFVASRDQPSPRIAGREHSPAPHVRHSWNALVVLAQLQPRRVVRRTEGRHNAEGLEAVMRPNERLERTRAAWAAWRGSQLNQVFDGC
jgi:hypothetical protein